MGVAAATPLLFSAVAFAGEITDLAAVDLSHADIVILGEVHDNPAHHAAQAEIVRAGAPPAVVFEMLTPEQADVAMAAGAGATEAALGDALSWAESGWPDFAMYYPVFVAAQGARLYGAALPRETVRAAFADGAAGQFGAEAGRFGLSAPLPDDEQQTREAGQMVAHCDAMPAEMMGGMVEAQRLRDAHFARVALTALEETGGPVVVITGNGHARTDWGMPAALAHAASDVSVLSLGQLEATPEMQPPYDLWRVTDPVDRDDPCAAFQ